MMTQLTCHPERSGRREVTPTQSKDPEEAGAQFGASGNSGRQVWRCENALQQSSGERVQGVLRRRGRFASRNSDSAQDDKR